MTNYHVIFGSRSGVPESVVRAYVNSLPQDTVVVTGGCGGVDEAALNAALARKMRVEVYPAQWDVYGRSAGPIRNTLMAKLATSGHGFASGWNSRGTNDCRRRLTLAGKRMEIDVNTWPATTSCAPKS